MSNSKHGVAATRGHLANNGGLRGHSVDDVFPLIVYAKGNPHVGVRWHIRMPDGKDWPFSYESAHIADDRARRVKLHLV